MKKILKNIQYFGIIGLLALNFASCREDNLYPEGKHNYSSKVQAVEIAPGKNRIQLSFSVTDPQVKKAKVFWNKREDFNEITINGEGEYSFTLEDMEEGDYSFEVITYDEKQNPSSTIDIVGLVYGDNYAQGLTNTSIRDITYENGNARIQWSDPNPGTLSNEVTYTNQAGEKIKKRVPASERITILENLKTGAIDATFNYRTLYRPDLNAIDSMYAQQQEATVITGNLRDIANARGILFGSLISVGVIYDGSPNGIYTSIASQEFNMGQATWGPSRWKIDAPSDFNDVNNVINWSKNQYGKVIVHLIVGPNNYMPLWFREGNFTPAEMDGLLKDLIYEFMESNDNKTKVDVWNVANELFNEDGTYRNMKWNDIGWEDDASGLTGVDQVNLKHPIFIAKALQYCREKTDAVLEIRDYGIENTDPTSSSNRKYKAFYELVMHLKAKEAPIDAVGIQSHLMIGKGAAVGTSANMNANVPAVGYEGFKDAIRSFKALGVDVYLTELDIVSIKINSQLQPWTDALAEQQKRDYYQITKSAIDAGVTWISLWGLKDDNDPGWRPGQSPLLFDPSYNRKPAYYGVQKALYEANK
jgi:GH35 family endo-1,4-beta-xylanase